jgi:DNA polymerase elongation subunit (family B)
MKKSNNLKFQRFIVEKNKNHIELDFEKRIDKEIEEKKSKLYSALLKRQLLKINF